MSERRAEPRLAPIAEAVADGAPVEWGQARDRLGDTNALRGLYVLQQVGEVFRQASGLAAGDETPVPPFVWGPLEVVERLGEGSFGVVYRAHDPHLGRDVALKLRKASAPDDPSWLNEARRLARVRHEHVLTVHGAAAHDGRDGFWADLIDGESLAARLGRVGPLDATELIAVGTTLCRALGALHERDIVHGDVKAANVLRGSDGRLVLVDLGAAHALGSGVVPTHGSPSTAAPEVLRGSAPTAAADLYGLASLLYQLATGALPTANDTWDQLVDPRRVDPTPLGDRRADLPQALTAVVDRGLAVDPERRVASARDMERALLASATPEPTRRAPAGRRRLAFAAVLTAMLVVMVGLGTSRALRRDGAGAGIEWIQARMVLDGAETTVLDEGAVIRPGDRLGLEVVLDRRAHLYVANEDDAGNVFTLFPLPGEGAVNPLPPGRHRLPGTTGGGTQSWVVTSAGGRERFLIVAASDALPAAERFVREVEAASTHRSVVTVDTTATEALRGVGGVVTSTMAEGSRLTDLQARLRAERASGVWMRLIELYNPP